MITPSPKVTFPAEYKIPPLEFPATVLPVNVVPAPIVILPSADELLLVAKIIPLDNAVLLLNSEFSPIMTSPP